MAYKPVAVLSVVKPIVKVKGIPEINEANPVIVGFRQADGLDNDKRQQFNFVPFQRQWSNGEVYAIEQFSQPGKPLGERRAFDIYLTMTECDILDPANIEDAPLFKFASINGSQKVAGGFEDFKKKFLSLPANLQLEIYEVCLEANSNWLGVSDDDDDDKDNDSKNE